MNEIRKINLETINKNIKAYPYDFINILNNAKQSNITLEVIETKSQKPSAKVIKNEKQILLHSAYDPIKEANTLIKEIENDEDLDLVFIFGIGAGYLINAVKKLNVSIAVIEPDINFFSTLIDNFRLDKILEDNKITFFIGGNDDEDIEKFISLNSILKCRNPVFTQFK